MPSPLKPDAEFMMSADDNSNVRHTSESGFSNNLPYQNLSNKKHADSNFLLRLQPCINGAHGDRTSEMGSIISALTEE